MLIAHATIPREPAMTKKSATRRRLGGWVSFHMVAAVKSATDMISIAHKLPTVNELLSFFGTDESD
jgi:hypothetical protein